MLRFAGMGLPENIMISAGQFKKPVVEMLMEDPTAFGSSDQDAGRHTDSPRVHRPVLIRTKNGSPKAVLANAVAMLRDSPEWKGVLARNEFSLATHAVKPTPWGFVGRWSEYQDARGAEWLQHKRVLVSSDLTARAVETVAHENPFHPVRDFLDGLKWDGEPRLDRWLHVYLGAEDNAYVRTVGRCWFISGVARIRCPGSKADHLLVLEGPQGSGKSSLCRVLGGEFFSDDIADLGSKDSALGVAGAWIIELSELDAMGGAAQSKIKAFISRRIDRFRPPYGRRLIEAPRQSIFIGTCNRDAYLKDETGGRRFWPVRCGVIDISALRRDRDQIWAEAQHEFAAGAHWWLEDTTVMASAVEEQAQRFEGDPWAEVITEWSATRETISVGEVLELGLKRPKAQWTQADKNRVAGCLRFAGWQRFQQRTENGREWRYRREH
jgi:predicted P-loop ATPase